MYQVPLSKTEIDLILTALGAYRDFIPVLGSSAAKITAKISGDPDGDPDVMHYFTTVLPHDIHGVFSKLFLLMQEKEGKLDENLSDQV